MRTSPLPLLEGREIAVELASVNRKGLEINLSAPREWQAAEREAERRIREHLQRGKVQGSIQLGTAGAAEALEWDDAALGAALGQLRSAAERHGLPFEPGADFLLRLVTAIGGQREMPAGDAVWPLIEPALAAALDGLVAMREAEGEALAADLRTRIESLRSLAAAITAASTNTVANQREALHQRLRNAGLDLDPDDDRVLREIALFADRCDISEELTRLDSHLTQFLDLTASSEAVGRRLDFLCQEINREINTIGAKANNLEVTRSALEAKNELERIREQVQNVE